jgi:hypothetical protein
LFVMHDLSRQILRALRQAGLYGYLNARDDGLFHPGGNHSLCRLHNARRMVTSGWLGIRNGRYELTAEGRRVAEAHDAIASAVPEDRHAHPHISR